MKAWRVDRPDGIEAIQACELESPALAPGEVLIDVHACGINFSDLLMVSGRYQIRPDPPFIPGQEIAGRIAAVGAGARHKVGERVATKVLWGGFATQVAAREDMLVRLPATMSYRAGATLPVIWPTAWIALFERARIAAGESVLVLAAAGGVGSAAVQLAAAAGCMVIAAVGAADKAATALAAGATHTVVTSQAEWPARVASLTAGRGPDVIFDPVGGAIAESGLKLIARNGRYLVVGFASGEIPRLAANRLLLKNASALGVYWSHELDGPLVARAMSTLFDLWAAGRIRVEAGRVYGFGELKIALADLAARRSIGKSVLEIAEES